MNKKPPKIIALAAFLLLITFNARAVPTLTFEGNQASGQGVAYDSGSGDLLVTATLTGSPGISTLINTAGSSLSIFASYLSNSSDTTSTAGFFSGIAGDDIVVTDGDSNLLLKGELSSLSMEGINELNSGLVLGDFTATGGSLLDTFGVGNLIAFEFDLTTTFSATMFGSSFSGDISGRLESVPEPGPLALMAIGFVLIGLMSRRGGATFA